MTGYLGCEIQLIFSHKNYNTDLRTKLKSIWLCLTSLRRLTMGVIDALWKNLRNYGIHDDTDEWIQAFIIDRRQRVVVDRKTSEWALVESRVSQGIVLGYIIFLAFINILSSVYIVKSPIRLFTDDAVMYRKVTSSKDCNQLQHDIHQLEKWGMATKCNIIIIIQSNMSTNLTSTYCNE